MTDPTEMSPALDTTSRDNASKLLRCLGDAILSLFLVAIPFFASGLSLGAVTGLQMGVGAIATLLGGVLGVIFGERLFNGVMRVLEGMGGY